MSFRVAITCSVPQGYVLSPLLFLLYINHMYVSSDKLSFYLFADDTTILYANKNLTSLAQIINQELCNLHFGLQQICWLWIIIKKNIHSGLSYHFNNITICIFDDEKFVNSNELTAVEPIDDIPIHMESPELKDKLLVGQCIANIMHYM